MPVLAAAEVAPASLQELAAPTALLEEPAVEALQEPPWLLRLKRQQALQVLLPLAAELLLAASLRRRRLVPQQAAALPSPYSAANFGLGLSIDAGVPMPQDRLSTEFCDFHKIGQGGGGLVFR